MAASNTRVRIRMGLRTAVIAVGKRAPFILDAARGALGLYRRFGFARLSAVHPVEPRTVIFECYQARGYSCSPRAIYRAMLADPRYDDCEFIWAFRLPVVKALRDAGCSTRGLEGFHAPGEFTGTVESVFGENALAELRRATIVPFASREYYRSYARAATWISNAIIPTHLRPGAGQAYVQCWHGTPLKRLGCDIPQGTSNAMFSVKSIHRRYRQEGRRLTRLVSPSPFTSEKLATAFDLPALGKQESIIEAGYPRNDFLCTATAQDVAGVKRRLGIPEHKRVLLYAPTWRDDQHTSGLGYTFEAQVDFARLREEIGDEWVVLFRAHYLIASSFDFSRHEGFVFDVSPVSDINDLYIVSDLLITDYSSVFFDYANLKRPMIFYMYDLEAYASDIRGFYLGLDELPGPIVRTHDELVAAIRSADEFDPEDHQAFRERFTPLDDGHAAERVLAHLRISQQGGARS